MMQAASWSDELYLTRTLRSSPRVYVCHKKKHVLLREAAASLVLLPTTFPQRQYLITVSGDRDDY